MRVKTAAGLMAVAGALVFASPAVAWTPKECDDWYAKHGTPHADCKAPPAPPPVAPPVAPPVVPPVAPPAAPPVAPPEAPPVVPPVTPPVAPPAPKVEKSKQPRYTHPDRPRTGTAGKTEQRGSSYTPQAQTRTVSASTENGTLPYTGLPAGIVALAGAGLFAAGFVGRRRVR